MRKRPKKKPQVHRTREFSAGLPEPAPDKRTLSSSERRNYLYARRHSTGIDVRGGHVRRAVGDRAVARIGCLR
jgi:hypothetical protein